MNLIQESTNPRTGNTTKVYVGSGSFEKIADGSIIIRTMPTVIVSDSEGVEIKRDTERSELAITLTAQQSAPFFAMFQAQYIAQKAAQAAAEASAAGSS